MRAGPTKLSPPAVKFLSLVVRPGRSSLVMNAGALISALPIDVLQMPRPRRSGPAAIV